MTPEHNPLHAGDTPTSHSLACMEVWGGSKAFQGSVAVPGNRVAVRCQPFEGVEHGGDIYYVSNCAAGLISRLALADVAGHGKEVAEVARRLRDIMRRHINTVDQSRFAVALNDAFSDPAQGGRFATAVLLTYFAPTDHLIVCNMGHPRPLWYQAKSDRWTWLQQPSLGANPNHLPLVEADDVGIRNLPLGVLPDTNYEQFAVKLEPGDIVIAYSDAFIESSNGNGRMLGEEGLRALASGLSAEERSSAVDVLHQRVLDEAKGGQSVLSDDATMVAMHHDAGDPPRLSLLERARSLGKMLGLSKVHVDVDATT